MKLRYNKEIEIDKMYVYTQQKSIEDVFDKAGFSQVNIGTYFTRNLRDKNTYIVGATVIDDAPLGFILVQQMEDNHFATIRAHTFDGLIQDVKNVAQVGGASDYYPIRQFLIDDISELNSEIVREYLHWLRFGNSTEDLGEVLV